MPGSLARAITGGPEACFGYMSGDGDVDLVGTAHGRAAYLLDGHVLLVDLSDGRTTQLADATHAQLTSDGLFYSSTVPHRGPAASASSATADLPWGQSLHDTRLADETL